MGSRQQGSQNKRQAKGSQDEVKEIQDVSPAPGVQGTSPHVAGLRLWDKPLHKDEVGRITDVLK